MKATAPATAPQSGVSVAEIEASILAHNKELEQQQRLRADALTTVATCEQAIQQRAGAIMALRDMLPKPAAAEPAKAPDAATDTSRPARRRRQRAR